MNEMSAIFLLQHLFYSYSLELNWMLVVKFDFRPHVSNKRTRTFTFRNIYVFLQVPRSWFKLLASPFHTSPLCNIWSLGFTLMANIYSCGLSTLNSNYFSFFEDLLNITEHLFLTFSDMLPLSVLLRHLPFSGYHLLSI